MRHENGKVIADLGDSFASIAHKLQISLADLLSANEALKGNRLEPGQSINLPDGFIEDLPDSSNGSRAPDPDRDLEIADLQEATSHLVKVTREINANAQAFYDATDAKIAEYELRIGKLEKQIEDLEVPKVAPPRPKFGE